MAKGSKTRARTTAHLLDAALELFAERGFYGASIEEICARAGLTRGAFYSNYATKEELFFQLFDMHAETVVERLTAAVAEISDADDPLDALVKLANQPDEAERRWFLISTEFSLYAMRNPQTAQVLADHDRRLREKVSELLGRSFERAGRRPTVDLDLLARLTTAVNEGGMMQSLVEPSELPFGELERSFLPTLLRAVSQQAER